MTSTDNLSLCSIAKLARLGGQLNCRRNSLLHQQAKQDINSIESSNIEEHGFTFYRLQQIPYRLFSDRAAATVYGRTTKIDFSNAEKIIPIKHIYSLLKKFPRQRLHYKEATKKTRVFGKGGYTPRNDLWGD